MMEPAIIEVTGLRKTFRTGHQVVHALRDLTFRINRGERLAIMGPSGSGKSTLFNMLGALDIPTDGQVVVAGVDLRQLNPRQLAFFRSRYIGYVFQSYNLLPAFSAEENVALPLALAGVPRAEALARARETLEEVGLGHRVGNRPDELSGGQQQRVAVARALVTRPVIVLADEPTANLDSVTGQTIIDLLVALSRSRGTTLITATHDHNLLASSDRILWIVDGRIDHIQTVREAAIKVGTVRAKE